VETLMQPIRACLSGASTHHETVVEACNRRGKPISCKVTITPMLDPDGVICGVILLMEQQNSPSSGED
jgi:hypothetical protein